jgi:hypothetical protein
MGTRSMVRKICKEQGQGYETLANERGDKFTLSPLFSENSEAIRTPENILFNIFPSLPAHIII